MGVGGRGGVGQKPPQKLTGVDGRQAHGGHGGRGAAQGDEGGRGGGGQAGGQGRPWGCVWRGVEVGVGDERGATACVSVAL